MTTTELFYKAAERNFKVFEIVKESDVENFYSLYPDKEKLRESIKTSIITSIGEIGLPEKTSIEIYLLLTEFCYVNKVSPIETCAIFKIIFNVLECFKENKTQSEIYDEFKKSVLTYAMNRFAYQVGILKKETVYLITNFFVDVIYRRYYLILYCLTMKVNIDLDTKEQAKYELPVIEDLQGANEILPRNAKILRQYFEIRRPKTELEQKIEMIIEFERDRLDKKMEDVFKEQDDAFNQKVDELLKKKK